MQLLLHEREGVDLGSLRVVAVCFGAFLTADRHHTDVVDQAAEPQDQQLGGDITRLMKTVEDYLKACGSAPEKEGLKKVFDAILESKDLQKEIREIIESHFLHHRKRKP